MHDATADPRIKPSLGSGATGTFLRHTLSVAAPPTTARPSQAVNHGLVVGPEAPEAMVATAGLPAFAFAR